MSKMSLSQVFLVFHLRNCSTALLLYFLRFHRKKKRHHREPPCTPFGVALPARPGGADSPGSCRLIPRLAECLRRREIYLFIFRYLRMPMTPVMIPVGRHATPIIQNQPSEEKCMIETPAINRATPERRYARRVLSLAKRVRSIASSSRKIRSSLSNLE